MTTNNNKARNTSFSTCCSWSCKCGQIKANLKGKPVLSFNCHCHSCVAAAKFIDKKRTTTNEKAGISIINSTGGVAISAFKANQVEFCTDLSEKLEFVRVGDNGEAWRSYTTCCGTQVTNFVTPKFIVLNRNAIAANVEITKEDESNITTTSATAAVMDNDNTILNIQKKDAFDPTAVPEPSHETTPKLYTMKFIFSVVNPCGSKKLQQYKELFPPTNEFAEVVPITWRINTHRDIK